MATRQEVPGSRQARRRDAVYAPAEAAELVKQTTTVEFDATIEAHLRLGVDPRHADQMVRGTVVLPHGTGKVVRVAVFAQGEKAQEALRAGADEVGGEDLVKRIEAGWLEFDVALATPGHDGPGRPARQDPRPARPHAQPEGRARSRSTSTARSARSRAAASSSRSTRARIIHVAVGKGSFEADALVANLAALVDAVNRAKPAGAKGQYLKGLTIASTMGPGIRVDIPAVLAVAAAASTRGRATGGDQTRRRSRAARDASPDNRIRRTAADSLRPRTAPTVGWTVGA